MNVIIPHDNENILDILPDDTIVIAASKIFRNQLGIMKVYEQGVLSEWEIETLHKMRVAVRRIRMAYRVLGTYISKQVIRPFIKDFQKLGDSLGKVRDLDVFLMNADIYKSTLGSIPQNIFGIMMSYFEGIRMVRRKELLELLNLQWYMELIHEFEQIIRNPQLWSKEKLEIKKHNQALPIAGEIIRFRYQKVHEFDPITGDEAIGRLHKLRIRVKACRYSIEFFERILGSDVRTLIESLITIQDYLGELNDAAIGSVFIDNLLKDDLFLSQHSSGVIHETSKYLHYLREQVNNRTTDFSSSWEIIHQPPFINALERII